MNNFLNMNVKELSQNLADDKWIEKRQERYIDNFNRIKDFNHTSEQIYEVDREILLRNPLCISHERLIAWFKDHDPDNLIPWFEEQFDVFLDTGLPFPVVFNRLWDQKRYLAHNKLALILSLNVTKFFPSYRAAMLANTARYLKSSDHGKFYIKCFHEYDEMIGCEEPGIVFIRGDNGVIDYDPNKTFMIDLGSKNKFKDTEGKNILPSIKINPKPAL